MGWDKTEVCLKQRVFSPRLYKMVERDCMECPQVPEGGGAKPVKAPLMPLPLVGCHFDKIALDIAGPFPHSRARYQYILVINDYATCFPEAVPLCSVTATVIAGAFLKQVTWVGIPWEIVTDQGKNFMSEILRGICHTLKIKQLQTYICHPKTDGLVERFNCTLKGMLWTCIQGESQGWDMMISPLLGMLRSS